MSEILDLDIQYVTDSFSIPVIDEELILLESMMPDFILLLLQEDVDD